MFERHVIDQLAAYDDDQLDESSASRVREHLQTCKQCRTALDDVVRARVALRELPPVTMPADGAARLEAKLRQPAPSAERPWVRVAALVAIGVATAAMVLFLRPPSPEIRRALQSVGLESVASDLHRQVWSGTLKLDLVSSDPARVRQWQREHTAPETALATLLPTDDWPRLEFRGASVVTANGARASLVAYAVNGRPVSLVTARQDDVATAPASAWFSKRVHFFVNADGHPTLTWSTSGQTYAIVSGLEGAGEHACLACHPNRAFKTSVEQAARRLLQSSEP